MNSSGINTDGTHRPSSDALDSQAAPNWRAAGTREVLPSRWANPKYEVSTTRNRLAHRWPPGRVQVALLRQCGRIFRVRTGRSSYWRTEPACRRDSSALRSGQRLHNSCPARARVGQYAKASRRAAGGNSAEHLPYRRRARFRIEIIHWGAVVESPVWRSKPGLRRFRIRENVICHQ